MIRDAIKKIFGTFGYEVRRKTGEFSPDLSEEFIRVWKRCQPYTMTSLERMLAVHDAVRYLDANRITGDFVESGVWRGGSSMNMALTSLELGNTDRNLYLFDTFAGMPEPSAQDSDICGTDVQKMFKSKTAGDVNRWCYASIEEVRENMRATGYPEDRVHLIKGKVEDTVPKSAPEHIALLRLDTDWFESTRHELHHLFPRLVPGGVLIIDDYGHWQGARKAVDAFFAEQVVKPLLFRIDYTGRMMLKVDRGEGRR